MILLCAVIGWFVLAGAFVLVVHAQKLRRQGRLTPFWYAHVLPWAVVGIALDVAFNLLVGWILFAESPIPREWLFSDRVTRHFLDSSGWRESQAVWWARQLNAIDPGHIPS